LDFESQGAAKTSFAHLAKNIQSFMFKTTFSKWMLDKIKSVLNQFNAYLFKFYFSEYIIKIKLTKLKSIFKNN
jgi:hypothetical protein